ncbi:NADH dehydrogenase subunit D [Limnochorda pilosa]|uniref:NADH-quinone oxidoreductase subunit D n=1 Tax=Limnochorda pilosa TaxID=1555112 RepID=A0A0K2SLH1_LIMPI|nr:NADH dehydrogenase subunit D [Limnochorda pilosa]
MPDRTDRSRSELLVSMGPQHPSTHGVLRLKARIDGERIVDVDPDVGYLHRCFEKHSEELTYPMVVPYTDRCDYLAGINNELTYALAVEKLLGLEIPPRAQYIRVITSELQRIASHLIAFGTFSMDLGATTAFLYCWRERETIIDLLEEISGARMLFHYVRIGGVRNDVSDDWLRRVRAFIDDFQRDKLPEYHQLITGNRIFVHRTKGIAVLSPEDAIAWGAAGPVLRASKVPFDLRKAEPYNGIERYDFQVPVGETGDVFDRYMIRMIEMDESAKIIRQALDGIEAGEVMATLPRRWKVQGETYVRTEGPKGEVGCYLIADGSDKPYRLRWRAPSFVHLQLIPLISRNHLIADLVAVIGSLDPVFGEVDR